MSDARPGEGLSEAQAQPQRSLAQDLRLRPERPRVVRISRRVLAGLSASMALVLSFALIWALQPGGNGSGSGELYRTNNIPEADELRRLPRDYTELPKDVPELGPPLPGDLGRPMRKAGVEPEPVAPPESTPSHPDPEAQRLAEERRRLAQEREAARLSELFASDTRGEAATAPAVSDERSQRPTPAVDAFSPRGLGQEDGQQTENERRLAFLNAPADRRTVSPDRVQAPASPYVLQAGAVIPAALMTGLRSDLPGQVTAQVTENVYDSPTGRVLLIPQGGRLIGQYDAQVAFGQRRAFLVWNRLIMPDGRSIVLERQPGADPSGFAGLEDEIDNHGGQVFRAALVSTLMSIGSQFGSSQDEDELISAIRRGSADGVDQIGEQLMGRSLDIQPTLTVRPGFPVRVIVTRDVILEPYSS
ncbi:MAG TPA: TrbI/VirB10 family protein [Mesorhizobium sp.]|jgi:type IV secretion system protein VirB10|nr:TrbI/VirB10 family protein [Mesorhizobium sp.]